MSDKTARGHDKGRKPPPTKSHRGRTFEGSRGRGKGGYRSRRGRASEVSGRERRDQGQTERPQLEITAGGQLPKWIREEVTRSTRKDRRPATLKALEQAASAFADGRYPKAAEHANAAKEMSSSNATIREILGLSLYRSSKWKEALQELKAFRRISGETTHMPVEMDCLRALGRDHDVEKVWGQIHELGGRPEMMREAKVVYGSHLLDMGQPEDAWKVTNPKKLTKDPHESDLRQWYVAVRAAAHLGDTETAQQLLRAISEAEPGFPGLSELEKELEPT
jgi:hypothetical protein